MPGGRPTKYKPEYTDLTYKFCLLGATDEDLAEFLDVAIATIYNWKKDVPEFLEAQREGKERADANVSDSLYKRAMGYSHPDTDIRVIDGEIVKTETTKHYAPDSTSMIFWLKNRQKAKWRDSQNIDHNVDSPMKVESADPLEVAKRVAFLLTSGVEGDTEE